MCLLAECPMTRGSLPNLRSDLVGGDNSGDSTESLIDEAEDYLRRSIDSMLTVSSTGVSSDYWNKQTARRRRARRYSEPDLIRDWHPPQDARPYLPKVNFVSDYCPSSLTLNQRYVYDITENKI